VATRAPVLAGVFRLRRKNTPQQEIHLGDARIDVVGASKVRARRFRKHALNRMPAIRHVARC